MAAAKASPRKNNPSIRVGIGGWSFPDWRRSFYPAGLPHARELEFASRALTSIEINGTFYRHQSPKSFTTWAETAPEGFVFAVKAHRATTHGKILADSGPAIGRFLASGLTALGPKLGPILWQFPPTRKFDPETAAAFLALLPAAQDGLPLRHAIEARHPSFEDPAWIALLRQHKAACVIVDSDKQSLQDDVTAPFLYLRLQRNEATAQGYDPAALNAWAARAKTWTAGKPVTDLPLIAPAKKTSPADCFIYFISGDKAHAPTAAKAMMERVGK